MTGGGTHLVKLWFSVSCSEQRTRFLIRRIDPVRQWKLSPTDLASLDRWDEYTVAKEAMFKLTDTPFAPWTVVKSNDKKRARIGAMRFVLNQFEYPRPQRRNGQRSRTRWSSGPRQRCTSTARRPDRCRKRVTTQPGARLQIGYGCVERALRER